MCIVFVLLFRWFAFVQFLVFFYTKKGVRSKSKYNNNLKKSILYIKCMCVMIV